MERGRRAKRVEHGAWQAKRSVAGERSKPSVAPPGHALLTSLATISIVENFAGEPVLRLEYRQSFRFKKEF